jgi:glucoamylase
MKINLRWQTSLTVAVLLLGLSAQSANRTFVSDLNDQFAKSIVFMTANMGGSDLVPGAIIAAPSHQHPDYYYHWVRDAALTLEAALDLYENQLLSPDQKKKMQAFFIDHLKFNQLIQQTSQRAEGLGEPKFSVKGEVYAFPWGRPQNDGPALRASALIRLLKLAVSENWVGVSDLKNDLYRAELPARSLVKADLEFVSHHWMDLNFDLWEEVYGSHFYSLMAQRKALADGIEIAKSFADFGAADYYRRQMNLVNAELEKFWNENDQMISATRFSSNPGKTNLDSAVILAVLHSNLVEDTFSFNDERVLATFEKLRQNFNNDYLINHDSALGTAFGRYPGDTYDGYATDGVGNPWVLTTAAAAEFMYRRASALALRPGTPVQDLRRLIYEGDLFLARVLHHRNADGSLSEQVNRSSGVMQGAPNLTWSHASFLTAKMQRDLILKTIALKIKRSGFVSKGKL